MPWIAGYPREKLDWFPTIDETKCVKCGICMNCGKNVFDWTPQGAVVARPYSCQPGCSTCRTLCLGDAINFPDMSFIRGVYKRERIWSKVKKQLIAEGKIPSKG